MKKIASFFTNTFFKITLFVICCVMLCTLFYFLMDYTDIFQKNINNTQASGTKTLVETEETQNRRDIQYILNKLEESNSKIAYLTQQYEKLNNKSTVLTQELLELQNQDPSTNLNNIKIIITLTRLQQNIEKKQNTDDNLKILKLLTKDDKNIYPNVLELENLLKQEQSDLIQTFEFEKHSIFTKCDKKDNFLKEFLKHNITIRKVKDFSENEQESIDYKIVQIENNIQSNNYSAAVKLIDEYKLENELPNTLNVLNYREKLTTIINGIVDFLYGKY